LLCEFSSEVFLVYVLKAWVDFCLNGVYFQTEFCEDWEVICVDTSFFWYSVAGD